MPVRRDSYTSVALREQTPNRHQKPAQRQRDTDRHNARMMRIVDAFRGANNSSLPKWFVSCDVQHKDEIVRVSIKTDTRTYRVVTKPNFNSMKSFLKKQDHNPRFDRTKTLVVVILNEMTSSEIRSVIVNLITLRRGRKGKR